MDTQPSWWQVVRHRIGLMLNPPDTKRDVSRLYGELLMAVESKYPGETRHETALRYIRSQEHWRTRVGAAKAVHNVELTGAARLYRAASSDRRERG